MSLDEAQPVQSKTEPATKKHTLEDCKAHNKEEDCWLVISSKVYDVTQFLDEHPGGFDIVLAATGKACRLWCLPCVSCDCQLLWSTIVRLPSNMCRAICVIRQGCNRGF